MILQLQGYLATSEDTFDCENWEFGMGGEVEAVHDAKHHMMHGPAQNVNNANDEKP